jgi:hypothetical protein
MTTEERLEKLEHKLTSAKRRNRWLLIGAAMCLGMIFAWAFFAQPGRLGTAQAEGPTTAPAQSEVRARSFVLEDEAGRVRAELMVLRPGDVAVRGLNDKPGTSYSGPVLVLMDEAGQVRVILNADERGKNGPGLSCHDNRGKLVAGITATNAGGVVFLSDPEGGSKTLLPE